MTLRLHYFLHKECYKKFFIYFFLVGTYSYASSLFKSLSDIEEYASRIDEFPSDFVDTATTASLINFCGKMAPTLREGIVQPGNGTWRGQEFASLLSQINGIRQKSGYQSPCVAVKKPVAGSQFIIFTELCSSFHTLVRALKTMQELKIIDDSLLIKDPKIYIVFNGNSVFSPIYSLDTLTIILRLIAVNPNNVIYIAQDEIKNSDWLQQPFVQELCARIKTKKNDENFPFEGPLKQFFSTLPLALYLEGDLAGGCLEGIRISADLKGPKMLSDLTLGNIMGRSALAVKIDKSLIENAKRTCVRAIITRINDVRNFVWQGILRSETQNDSLVIWRTLTNARGYCCSSSLFSNGSFVVVNTSGPLKTWSIQLFSYQNASEKFVPMRLFNLLTGDELPLIERAEYDISAANKKLTWLQEQVERTKKELAELDLSIKNMPIAQQEEIEKVFEQARAQEREIDIAAAAEPVAEKKSVDAEIVKEALVVVPESTNMRKIVPVSSDERLEKKFHKEVLNIGSTLSLSRMMTNRLVSPIKDVLEAYFGMGAQDKLYKNRIVKMIILDDEFIPARARENVLSLKRDFNVNIILCAFGTPHAEAYFDLIKDGSIFSLFPFAFNSTFLDNGLKNAIFFGIGNFAEEYWVTKYAIEKLSAKKIAIFYLPIVNRYLEGAKKALDEAKFKNYIAVPHVLESANFTEQAAQIKSFDPDTIILSSNYEAAISLFNELGANWLLGKKIVVASAPFTNVEVFDKYCSSKGVKYLIASQVPNPATSNLEVVKDFRSFAYRYSISIGTVELYIYMCCRIFTEIVNKIEGPVTVEKVKEVAEHFKNYDLGGITLTFNPNDRNLVNSIWLNDCTDEWSSEWKKIDIKIN